MTARVRALPRRAEHAFYAALKKAGAIYCAACRGYAYPDHVEHVNLLLLALDTALAPGYLAPAVVELVGELEEASA